MLHEMGHGLGFAGRTSLSNGALSGGYNDIYSSFVYSNTYGKAWAALTNGERVIAAKDDGNMVFRGPNVVAEAPLALGPPVMLNITAPQSVAGSYEYGAVSPPATATAENFGGSIVDSVTVPGSSPDDGLPTEGCVPFANADQVVGNIVMIDRGTCTFDVKVENAKTAGASGVILVNNVDGPLSPAVSVELPEIGRAHV